MPTEARGRRSRGRGTRSTAASSRRRPTISPARAVAPQAQVAVGAAQLQQADVGRRRARRRAAAIARAACHRQLLPRRAAMQVEQPPRPSSSQRADLVERSDGLVPGRLDEADAAADRRLAEPPQVGLDHGADLRVAARRLGVAHLHDRLAAVRHLDDAGHDAVRAHLHRRDAARSGVAGEPVAVAVALRRDLPGARPRTPRARPS